nr:hypothetical protein CFP56_70007 [Quercus suber]
MSLAAHRPCGFSVLRRWAFEAQLLPPRSAKSPPPPLPLPLLRPLSSRSLSTSTRHPDTPSRISHSLISISAQRLTAALLALRHAARFFPGRIGCLKGSYNSHNKQEQDGAGTFPCSG